MCVDCFASWLKLTTDDDDDDYDDDDDDDDDDRKRVSAAVSVCNMGRSGPRAPQTLRSRCVGTFLRHSPSHQVAVLAFRHTYLL